MQSKENLILNHISQSLNFKKEDLQIFKEMKEILRNIEQCAR